MAVANQNEKTVKLLKSTILSPKLKIINVHALHVCNLFINSFTKQINFKKIRCLIRF